MLMVDGREPDDSGIDSDDTMRRLLMAHRRIRLSDEGSSDEDVLEFPSPATHRRRMEQLGYPKDIVVDHGDLDMQRQERNVKNQAARRENSPDRASPPLYEVELTASDEDDDTSVLELVIPMHSSRYQRVPTSSPKKTKPKVVKRYFCSMICCGRK